MSNEVKCPKCGSNQFAANQKGFSSGKAIGGAILTGGVGLLAGFIGSKKVIITCLACGNKFKPGEWLTSEEKAEIEKKERELKRLENEKEDALNKETFENLPSKSATIGIVLLIVLLYTMTKGCS